MTSKAPPGPGPGRLIWSLTTAWSEYLRPPGSLREEDGTCLPFFEPLDT